MSKSLSRALSFLKSRSFRAKKGKGETEDDFIFTPEGHRDSAGESALAQIGDEEWSSPNGKERMEEDKTCEEDTTVLSEQDTELGDNSAEDDKSGCGSVNLDEVIDNDAESGRKAAGEQALKFLARKQLFFDSAGERQGPLRFKEMAKRLKNGGITEETKVWYKDLGDQFVPLADLPELLSALRISAEKRKTGEDDGYAEDFESAEEEPEEDASKVEQSMPDAWKQVSDTFPLAKTPEDREKRALLFLRWDPNGNGYLSLAEIDRGIQETSGLEELFKCKPAIIRAYKAAKGLKKGREGSKDDDYVSKIEFRMLLVYLKLYFGLFCIFAEMDTGHDRRVDIDEFRAAASDLRELGCPIADDSDETFRVIDKDGGGQILFNEFCEWAIANNMLAENAAGPPMPVPAAHPASVVLPKIEEVSEEERYTSDDDHQSDDDDDDNGVRGQSTTDDLAAFSTVDRPGARVGNQASGKDASEASPEQPSPTTIVGQDSTTSESWSTVVARLPVEQTATDKMKRAQLFSLWDPNGNGFLSLAEVDRGVSITQGLEELYKCKPALLRAFNASKSLKPGDPNKKGLQDDDYVSRIEFRMLLVYLKLYYGLFQIFDQIDTDHDRRVDIDEFRAAASDLRELGCPIADDSDETFRVIDKDGGGQILFNEFCEWAIDNNLLLDPSLEGKKLANEPASRHDTERSQHAAACIPTTGIRVATTTDDDDDDKPLQGMMSNVRGQMRELNSELSDMRERILQAMEKRNQAKNNLKSHRGFGLPVAATPRASAGPASGAGSDQVNPSPKQSSPPVTLPHVPTTPKGPPPQSYTPRDESTFRRLTTNFQRLQQPAGDSPAARPVPVLPRTQSDGAKKLAERLWGEVKPRYLQRSRSQGMLDRHALSSSGSARSSSSVLSSRSDVVRMPPTDKYVWGKGAAQRAAQRAEDIKRMERAEAMEKGRGVRVDPRDRLAQAQATLEFRGERHIETGAFRPQPTTIGRPYEWGV